MKKSGLPVWFPNVNSWLSALTLSVVISGLISIARDSDSLLPYLARLSNKPELLTIVSILILLSPLPAIALCHHFVFSRFIPIIPGRKRNKEPGLVPGADELVGKSVRLASVCLIYADCNSGLHSSHTSVQA